MTRPLLLIIGFVLTITAAAAQMTAVGPEQPLTVPELHDAPFDQSMPAVASDGNGWLVVWVSGGAHLVATEVDGDGDVVDRTPLSIASGNVAAPGVAFGGGSYLVAWSEDNTVRFRSLSTDGSLSPSTIITTTGSYAAQDIHVAYAAGRFLVVWTKPLNSNFYPLEVRAAIIDLQGHTVATMLIGLASWHAAVAAASQAFFVATPQTDGSLAGKWIDPSGKAEASVIVAPPGTGGWSQNAASDGSSVLVTWVVFAPPPASNEYRHNRAIVARDGSVTPAAPSDTGSPLPQTLTWSGANYVATFSFTSSVQAIAIDRNGNAGAPVTIVATTPSLHSDAAWNGRAVLVAMGGDGGSGLPVSDRSATLRAKFIDSTAQAVDPSRAQRAELVDPASPGAALAFSPRHQQAPAIASMSTTDSLVVWSETFPERSDNETVAMPLRNGLPRLAQPIVLGATHIPPVVATNGNEYLVVWVHWPEGLLGMRVDVDGKALDPTPFVVSTSVGAFGVPAASWDGANFLVAYEVGAGCFHSARMTQWVTRVSPGGIVDPVVIPINGISCGARLSLASGPEGSVLAWDGTYSFLTHSGSATPPASGGSGSGPTAVTWTGSRFLVVSAVGNRVTWTTLDANGFSSGSYGPPIMLPPGHEYTASIDIAPMLNGAIIALVAGPPNLNGRGDVLAARITNDGTAIGGTLTISSAGFIHRNVSLAGDASGRAFVVYDRTVDVPGLEGMLTRAFLRELDASGAPPRRRGVGH